MADPSFDVVSKVDRQEVDNALNQTAKEISTRFDFRNTGARINWSGEEAVTIEAETEERCAAAIDVFKEKLIKRGISLKAFEVGDPAPSGKKKDHLQEVIALLKNSDFDIALQFTNYR